jgi:hypothetical protein
LLNKYAKYAGFAFQMIAVFVGLSLGGNWLDEFWHLSFPYFTLGGVFVALFVVFYSLFTIINSDNNETTRPK